MIRAVLGMGIIAGLWFMSPERESYPNSPAPLEALLATADSPLGMRAVGVAVERAAAELPTFDRAVAGGPAGVRRILTDGAVQVDMPALRR